MAFGTTASLQWPPVINITSVRHDRSAELSSACWWYAVFGVMW
jgi:hypothetical protein